MGQCQAPTVSPASELTATMPTDIVVTLKVAPQIGMTQETTWEVRVENGDTVAMLKQRICELYETPAEMQIIKRLADGQPLQDDEKLDFRTDKTLHFSLVNPLESMMQAMSGAFAGAQGPNEQLGTNPLEGLMQAMNANVAAPGNPSLPGENPFAAIMQAMTEAHGTGQQSAAGQGAAVPNGFADIMASAMANVNAMQENLNSTTLNLKFVMAAQRPTDQEKRCSLEVTAGATLANVLEMVKMELNVEDQNLALEFCGETLPAVAPVHLVGLSDGDTVKVVAATSN